MTRSPTTAEPRRLQQALRALRGRRVAVLGDSLLDCFLRGDATRLSPEAPVPVVLLENQTWSLGGAANVAANIAALGGRPLLLTAVGQDAAGQRLRRLAAAAGIELVALPLGTHRPTTVKYRVLAGNKQLLRLDREATEPLPATVIRQLLKEVAKRDGLEAVVVSDYAKGLVTPQLVRGLSRFCTQRQVPWCVDPKLALRYRHATVLKPNQLELEKLSGMPARSLEDVQRAAHRVLRRQGCQYLLVTRGQRGMLLCGADGSELLLPSHNRAVADVTGAGDTVTAVLGLGLAAGLDIAFTSRLANLAAGFVVGEAGTAVIRAADLLDQARVSAARGGRYGSMDTEP